MKNTTQQGFAPIIIILIAIGLMGGGTSVVVASNDAKPGDFLYPVDTTVEDIQLALRSGEGEIELRTKIAAERVTEVEELLEEKGVEAPGLDVALANLTEQRKVIADIVATKAELKTKARAIDAALEKQEERLETIFDALKAPLKAEKKELKAKLKAAIEAGDTILAGQLAQQLAQVKVQLKAIE